MQLTIRRRPVVVATADCSAAWNRWAQTAIVVAALAGGLLWQGRESERSSATPPARRVEDYRFVPVRVHLLRAPGMTAVGVTLTKADIERIFRKANGIWQAAGVRWWVESVMEEPPAAVDNPHADVLNSADELPPLRPKKSRAEGMFHVYYVGHMGVNGIFIERDAIFVQQAAQLREVEGGIDEPLPRVTSHELGHGLGLPHRQARTNLMASGTTGTALNDEEIATVRATCAKTPWILTTSAFLDAADKLAKAGKREEARSRYQAVADLPGESPLKERARSALSALSAR